jgi:hypothetical protein
VCAFWHEEAIAKPINYLCPIFLFESEHTLLRVATKMSRAIKSALDSFLFRIFQLIQIQEGKLIESRRVNATLIRGEERWLSPAVGPVY